MMKFDARSILLAAAATFATLGAPVPAASQVDLATGLDAAGNLQYAGGSRDAHWEVTGAPNPLAAPHAYVVAPGDLDSWFPPGGWPPNGPNSSWIAANPFEWANGNETFTLKFTVSDPSTAAILYGSWTVDESDGGTLSLNGVTLSTLGFNGRESMHHFSTVPGDFVAGLNVLTMQSGESDFQKEGGRLEGLIVGGGTVTLLSPFPPSAIPEASTWAMLLAGFAGLGLRAIARRGRSAALAWPPFFAPTTCFPGTAALRSRRFAGLG